MRYVTTHNTRFTVELISYGNVTRKNEINMFSGVKNKRRTEKNVRDGVGGDEGWGGEVGNGGDENI